MNSRSLLSKNLKEFRSLRDLTQAELAKRAKLSIRFISQIETTADNVSLEILDLLAKALAVRPAELISDNKVTEVNVKADSAIRKIKKIVDEID